MSKTELRQRTLKDYWKVYRKAKDSKIHKPNPELDVQPKCDGVNRTQKTVTYSRKLYNLRRRKFLPDSYSSQRQTELPLDIILVVTEYSTLQVILALCQTCSRLRHLCAQLHLRKLGILNSGPATTEIRLVGGPFSAPILFLFRNLTPIRDRAHRISLVIDFYHITSFLCDVQLLLKANIVNFVELTIFDDEHALLDNRHLSGSLLNILSHLHHCKRLRFTAGPERLPRPLLRQNWIPVYTPKPGRVSIRKGLASLTEFHLSLPIFYRRSLKNSVSFLLHHPSLTYLSLICSTASESGDILSNALLPALENLNVQVRDASLAILPQLFLKSHSNLHHVYLSALFPWHEASFKPSGTRIMLPSLASATISSKYAGFDIINSSSLLDLHICSFMAFPIPENRGYCDAVQSLVDFWLDSKEFWPVADFTASFTFPRRLSSHLDFLDKVPVFRCSCTPATLGGRLVYGIRRIKIFLDNVTLSIIRYISKWICHFADVQELTIIAELISVDLNSFSIDYFRGESPNIQHVSCTANLHSQ